MALKNLLSFWLLTSTFFVHVVFAADRGPLQVPNRFPLHLMFLTPQPVPAESLAPNQLQASVAFDYSSVYFDHQNSRWDVLMDMEMTVLDIRLAYGLTPQMEIRMDVPIVTMDNGFLDGFLKNYHDTLGVGNYGRENRPENNFAFSVYKEGDLWLQGQSGRFELADMTVSAKWKLPRLMDWDKLKSAVGVSIQLPTGDPHAGFGNGGFDFGFYLPLQWSGHRWSYYFMPGLALFSDPDTRGADVSSKESIGFLGGGAYHYSSKLDLNAQVNYYTSPIEHTGISQLDDGAMELALGFKYRLSRCWFMEFAFCEDLMRAAPDFTLHLNLIWQKVFGNKGR